jgi:hypothetical protein
MIGNLQGMNLDLISNVGEHRLAKLIAICTYAKREACEEDNEQQERRRFKVVEY